MNLSTRGILTLTALLAGTGAGCADKTRFDGELAMAHLRKQVAFGPRVPGTPQHKACRDYLAAELRTTCDEVRVQSFTWRPKTDARRWRSALRVGPDAKPPPDDPIEMANVVGVIKGTDGAPPKLLLCAHWDTRPTADMERRAADRLKPILGANDGASGVAVLLELARVLKERRPAAGVIIAFFDGEDYGPGTDAMFLGSRHYALRPVPHKPSEAILLDMVGDADLLIHKEAYSENVHPQLNDTFFATAAKLGYGDLFVPRVKDAVEDDHVALIRQGIPAIDIIDFDYPHWHTLADTPDKCSPASLEAVGRTLAAVVYQRKGEPAS